MNTQSEEAPENGNQRRKSLGSGGGANLAGGKSRRYSIGVASTRKSIGEEGNVVPNYLRASTGSCHDFCKFGKKHEHSKSAIPIKFKRTAVVEKNKLSKTVVPLEKKNKTPELSAKPEIQTSTEPVKLMKKNVLLPSKKAQVHKQSSSTNGKATKNELEKFRCSTSLVKSSPVVVNREGSDGGIKKKDIRTIKKTGITPKTDTVKKVFAKVTPNGPQPPKASFNRAASVKAVKSRGFKQVSPLKDQNRMQKTEPKHTIDDKVQTKSLHGVEAELEVKPETMEFDFIKPSIPTVNPPACSSSDAFSDINVVEEESPIIHPVNVRPEPFSDNEALVAPPVSVSPDSLYDDEALENESDYTDDEEVEFSEDGSETADINGTEASVGNHKIPRKGKMIICEDKNDEAVKLRFRRGKVLVLQSENNSPRRLKFRRRAIERNADGQNITRKTFKNKTLDLQTEITIPRKLKFANGNVMEGNEGKQRASRRSFEKKIVEEANDSKYGPESVVLKHQGEQEKKDAQGLLNNVIEETASKLVESRKSKVKALVGAFETVISLQDGKAPSS